MQVRALRRLASAATTTAVTASLTTALAGGLAVLPVATPAASADPITNLLTGGAPHAIYLVKDLGGGAYWNITTQSMYVLQAGSELLISGAQTTADLVATLAANGRDLLLLINGAVLVPVQKALGG